LEDVKTAKRLIYDTNTTKKTQENTQLDTIMLKKTGASQIFYRTLEVIPQLPQSILSS